MTRWLGLNCDSEAMVTSSGDLSGWKLCGDTTFAAELCNPSLQIPDSPLSGSDQGS